MKKLTFLFLIIMMIMSCNNQKKETQLIIPKDIKWEIISEKQNGLKSTDVLDVVLNKKVSLLNLKKISLKLREEKLKYPNLYIYYNLSKDHKDGVCWADAQFNPIMHVTINGSSHKQDSLMMINPHTNSLIIGKWKCEKSLMGAVIYLTKDSLKNYEILTKMKDGAVLKEQVTFELKKFHKTFLTNNKFGEYYIIEKNGNLGMYDKDGKFDEAIKIKKN